MGYKEWEKLQVKSGATGISADSPSDGIIPVSVRLKTTVRSEKPGKLLERDLLWARVKSNNSFLDNISKQLDRCRSQLVSLVTTTIMKECQNLINKVREFIHSKLRDRQINKFNRLVDKQGKGEGRLANTSHNHQQGRNVGSSSGCNPHPGQSPSASSLSPR